MTHSQLQAIDNTQDVQPQLHFDRELVAANPKALLASHALASSAGHMCMVEDIHVLPDFNPRVKDQAYFDHIRNIADSIKEEGFYRHKPLGCFGALVGKKPTIYVTDGHCRLEGLLLAISEGAPITEVPIVLSDRSVTMEDLTVALARTSEGKVLTPIELAVVCKRLANFGWTPVKISQKLSKTQEYVSQLLRLVGAPSDVRAMVQDGRASAGVAINALTAHGEQAGEVLVKALEVAKASGKTRVTQKFMPDQARKSALKKAVPRMVEALEKVKSDKSYAALPDDLRGLIADILESITEPENVDGLGEKINLVADAGVSQSKDDLSCDAQPQIPVAA